jgi:hypothetical protein
MFITIKSTSPISIIINPPPPTVTPACINQQILIATVHANIHGQSDPQTNGMDLMRLFLRETAGVVQWISWYLDSRDDEYDSVSWNGVQIWRDRTNYNCDFRGLGTWTSATKELGFYLPWGGNGRPNPCYQEVTRKVKCGAGNHVLRFTSDIDQAISDESWCVDPLHTHVYPCLLVTTHLCPCTLGLTISTLVCWAWQGKVRKKVLLPTEHLHSYTLTE